MPSTAIQRVLVGIDFSDSSYAAARLAERLARHLGAELCLLHVGMVPEYAVRESSSLSEPSPESPPPFETTRRALQRLKEELAGAGARVKHAVYEGHPDTGLCRAASELAADLVVVGGRESRGVKRLLLGNVGERVVRGCDRTVLVARANEGRAGGFRRVLVPIDFSEFSTRAFDTALLLADGGGRLDLLHCREDGGRSGERPPRELLHSAERWGIEARFDVAQASPVDCILERLRGGDYDLVVLGSHGRRGARRWLLGSVAEATARHAPCSVAVVHRGAEAS